MSDNQKLTDLLQYCQIQSMTKIPQTNKHLLPLQNLSSPIIQYNLKISLIPHSSQSQMLKQQITPWTIYDTNGKKISQQQQALNPSSSSPSQNKLLISQRLLKNNKQTIDKISKINTLIADISVEKNKLNQKINLLTGLKIIRGHLWEENNPISQIKMYLPKIREEGGKDQHRHRIGHGHNSDKLTLLHNLQQKALDDFSKIFISASLQPTKNPSSILNKDSKTIVAKPEFPKIKKNSSVLLPDLEIRKQFDDNSIHEVIESAKRNGKKRNSVSLLYDFSN